MSILDGPEQWNLPGDSQQCSRCGYNLHEILFWSRAKYNSTINIR